MTCKSVLKITFLIVLLGLQSSCKWLGEKSYKPKTVGVTSEQKNCFANFSTLVNDYFSAEADANEINYFFDCVEESIDDFMRRTVEKNPEKGYSEAEIASLLESFLLENRSDGASYARRLLVLKRAFVGGDPKYFKRSEWLRMKILWPNIKHTIQNTKDLTDSYYFFNRSLEYFKIIEKKQDQFYLAYKNLLDKFTAAGGQLNNEELMFFKNEILNFDSLTKFKPVFDGLFDLYTSFPSIEPAKWPQAFELIEKSLRVNAYIRRAALEPEVFTPNSTVYYALVIKSVIEAIDYAYILNWENPIEQGEVEKILLGLYDSKIIFKNVETRGEYISALRKLGENFFSVQYNDGRWSVSREDIDFLKYKFNTWVQTLIEVLNDYNSESLVSQYNELLFDFDDIKNYQEKAAEIYKEIVLKSHIYNPMQGGQFDYKAHTASNPSALISTHTQGILNHFYQGSLANIALLLFDSYGKQRNVSVETDKLISENTVERIYKDLRPIMVAENLINPLSCTSGSRSFLEANLFSYSGNGDDKVDVYEGVQWFSSILSASTTSNAVYAEAIEFGCAIPGSSSFQGRKYIDSACFKDFFQQSYAQHLYHIPGFLNFIESGNFNRFYDQYIAMVRTCKDAELPLSFDEVQYGIALLQYIEALFEVFDQDSSTLYVFNRPKNNVLEFSELWNAYDQRFKGVVKRLGEAQAGKELSDTVVEHIYRKLITDKTMPYTPSGTWDSAMWFLGSRSILDPEAYDRLDIYEIFDSVLTAIAGNPRAIGDYCQSLKLAWEEYKLNQTFSVSEPKAACIVPAEQ